MWFSAVDGPVKVYARRLHLVWNGTPAASADPQQESEGLRGTHLLLLGFKPEERLDLCRYLKHERAFVSWSSEVWKLSADPQGCSAFDAIIVNLDAFEDLDTGVDTLLFFRLNNPSIAIVLVSTRVNRDDFGDHRRAICDATLRSPATPDRLVAAVKHSLWRRRPR